MLISIGSNLFSLFPGSALLRSENLGVFAVNRWQSFLFVVRSIPVPPWTYWRSLLAGRFAAAFSAQPSIRVLSDKILPAQGRMKKTILEKKNVDING